MSQANPGGLTLPPMSMSDMLKGPQLQRPLDTRPGQCTKDDPQGVAHNGTQGRVYTQYVTSRDPADDRKQRENLQRLQSCLAGPFGCGPALMHASGVEFQNASGKIEMGPFKASGDTEKGLKNVGLREPKKDADGKEKYTFKAEGEVCIVRSRDRGQKTGKWGMLELKAGPFNSRIGLGGGPLCFGASTEKVGFIPAWSPP